MTLSIDCEWNRAPNVRAPELAATWARLRITVNDDVATLVKDHESPFHVRVTMDVAAYPLAEWLALNWWSLETTSHVPYHRGISLAGAGDGFPWPALTLRSDREQMWVRLAPRPDSTARVRVIGSIDALLEREEVLHELSRFIDGTVRRLKTRA